jgi:hypothetical protein
MTANVVDPSNDRFHEEGDWMARQFFAPTDLQMSPEEYAARYAHLWNCFSLHRYRFQDPVLGAWVRRLGEILFTEGEVERCRLRYLTPAELAGMRRQATEEF